MQTQSIEPEYSNQLLGIVKENIPLRCQIEALHIYDYDTMRDKVYKVIKNSNGLTDREIVKHMNTLGFRIEKSSATARRNELVKLKLVYDTKEFREEEVGSRTMHNTIWKAR